MGVRPTQRCGVDLGSAALGRSDLNLGTRVPAVDPLLTD
jgi:hypothetical protein